jgi:hypothetical protein
MVFDTILDDSCVTPSTLTGPRVGGIITVDRIATTYNITAKASNVSGHRLGLEVLMLPVPLHDVLVGVNFESRITIRYEQQTETRIGSNDLLCMSFHQAKEVIITKVEALLEDL